MGGYINSEMVYRNNIIDKNLIYSYTLKELSNLTLKSTKNLFNNWEKAKRLGKKEYSLSKLTKNKFDFRLKKNKFDFERYRSTITFINKIRHIISHFLKA